MLKDFKEEELIQNFVHTGCRASYSLGLYGAPGPTWETAKTAGARSRLLHGPAVDTGPNALLTMRTEAKTDGNPVSSVVGELYHLEIKGSGAHEWLNCRKARQGFLKVRLFEVLRYQPPAHPHFLSPIHPGNAQRCCVLLTPVMNIA